MTVEWEEADPSVSEVIRQMIGKYHPDLHPVSIGVLFRSEPQTKGGRIVWANISIVPAKLKPMLDYDLILWVVGDQWRGHLTDNQRMAMIDHELCHVEVGDNDEISIVGHDIEEFGVVLDRWGLWTEDLKHSRGILTKATQGELFEPAHAKEPGKVESIPEVVISHVKPDGTKESVEFGRGEFDKAAKKLLHSFKRRSSHASAD